MTPERKANLCAAIVAAKNGQECLDAFYAACAEERAAALTEAAEALRQERHYDADDAIAIIEALRDKT